MADFTYVYVICFSDFVNMLLITKWEVSDTFLKNRNIKKYTDIMQR